MFCTKLIRKFGRILCGVLGLTLLCGSFPSYAVKESNIAANQSVAVESNDWTDWPQGPVVSAESAILMEAETGTILYAKNIHKQQYPASITKILTTLIAIESCELDEMVTFSYDAVHDIDKGSNHIAMDEGEQLPMEDCLKAILIRSANEVSLAVAEHISGGKWESFAEIMNERAVELGCLNSNFVNPNGLPNEEHVTTAYDMAMIGRAFFANEILCNMTLMKQLHLYPTDTQPDEVWENNQMALLPGKEYAYEYLVGCKTGYTNVARSTLVSCAEKDGLKLICVVLKDESPYQYEDTIALFDYGFSNFEKRTVAEYETDYNIGNEALFYSDYDIFGSSKPIVSLNQEDFVVVPKTADFQELKSEISYETDSDTEAAVITYTYHDIPVGSASIDFALDAQTDYEFEIAGEEETASTTVATPRPAKEQEKEPSFVFINLKNILIIAAVVAGVLVLGVIVLLIIRNYNIYTRRRKRRGRRQRSQSYGDLSYDLQKKRRQQIADAKRRQRKRGWH